MEEWFLGLKAEKFIKLSAISVFHLEPLCSEKKLVVLSQKTTQSHL
jgi:hypothetical protein